MHAHTGICHRWFRLSISLPCTTSLLSSLSPCSPVSPRLIPRLIPRPLPLPAVAQAEARVPQGILVLPFLVWSLHPSPSFLIHRLRRQPAHPAQSAAWVLVLG